MLKNLYRFNRDIVECKEKRSVNGHKGDQSFNRDIVECKGRVDNGFKHGDNTVLIET